MPEPLRQGEHCFYYDPEGDNLVHVVRSALADKDRLRRMREAARRHVMQHRTHGAIAARIREAAGALLGRDPLQGGFGQA